MANKVDLAALAALPNFSGTFKAAESDAEIAARITRENADAAAKLWRENLAFVAALVCGWTGSIALVVVGFYFAVTGAGELQKWAMSLVTLVVGTVLGFFTGKATGKASAKE
jgi:uncharacterized membrane protein